MCFKTFNTLLIITFYTFLIITVFFKGRRASGLLVWLLMWRSLVWAPSKAPFFLEQDTWPVLLSTGGFQEQIWLHNQDWHKCQIRPLVKYRQNQTKSFQLGWWPLGMFHKVAHCVGNLGMTCYCLLVFFLQRNNGYAWVLIELLIS